MNGVAHALSTLAALDSLPAWQQHLWAPERTALAEEYSLYGDTYAVRQAELAPYVELPDGSVPDFYMPKLRWKRHYAPAIDFWEAPFYDRTVATFQHFAGAIADALRRGDVRTAAKFAGTFAHYVEDNACPGHAMDDTDLEIVKDLLPPPERLRRFPYHPRMELAPPPFGLEGRAPVLLGQTVADGATAFVNRLVAMTLASRRTVLPFFQSIYDGDTQRAAELNLGNCRLAAALLADFLHTAACIALDRFSASDRQVAASRSLVELYPYRQTAWAPEPYAQTAPGELLGVNLNATYEPVPCVVRAPDGQLQTPATALGATAYYEYDFHVPAGLYRQFACTVGVHATLGARFPLTFAVYGDDDLLGLAEQQPTAPASTLELDWPATCTHLRLVTTVADAVPVQRVNKRPVAPTGHAVWADPLLRR
jgi:hypothetical protein